MRLVARDCGNVRLIGRDVFEVARCDSIWKVNSCECIWSSLFATQWLAPIRNATES